MFITLTPELTFEVELAPKPNSNGNFQNKAFAVCVSDYKNSFIRSYSTLQNTCKVRGASLYKLISDFISFQFET